MPACPASTAHAKSRRRGQLPALRYALRLARRGCEGLSLRASITGASLTGSRASRARRHQTSAARVLIFQGSRRRGLSPVRKQAGRRGLVMPLLRLTPARFTPLSYSHSRGLYPPLIGRHVPAIPARAAVFLRTSCSASLRGSPRPLLRELLRVSFLSASAPPLFGVAPRPAPNEGQGGFRSSDFTRADAWSAALCSVSIFQGTAPAPLRALHGGGIHCQQSTIG